MTLYVFGLERTSWYKTRLNYQNCRLNYPALPCTSSSHSIKFKYFQHPIMYDILTWYHLYILDNILIKKQIQHTFVTQHQLMRLFKGPFCDPQSHPPHFSPKSWDFLLQNIFLQIYVFRKLIGLVVYLLCRHKNTNIVAYRTVLKQ